MTWYWRVVRGSLRHCVQLSSIKSAYQFLTRKFATQYLGTFEEKVEAFEGVLELEVKWRKDGALRSPIRRG